MERLVIYALLSEVFPDGLWMVGYRRIERKWNVADSLTTKERTRSVRSVCFPERTSNNWAARALQRVSRAIFKITCEVELLQVLLVAPAP
jgi:hypothetical protein